MSRRYKWFVAGYAATALLSLTFLAAVMLGCQDPVTPTTPTTQTTQATTHLTTALPNTEAAADYGDFTQDRPTVSATPVPPPSATTAPPSPPATIQQTTAATEPAVDMPPSNTTAPDTVSEPAETIPETIEATATEDPNPQLGQDGYYNNIIRP